MVEVAGWRTIGRGARRATGSFFDAYILVAWRFIDRSGGCRHNPRAFSSLDPQMTRLPFPLEQVGPHELTLRETIAEFTVPASVTPCPEPVVIMLFTNRSGSSMVAEHLRATGRFRGMGEPLNPGFMLAEMGREGLSSLHAYLRSRVERGYGNDSVFGMKASLQQVTMLLRAGVVPGYFGNIRWVYVQRRDLVAQAVSFVIASQTKRWESFAAGTGGEPEYSFEQIRRKLEALSMQNAAISAFFSVMDVEPCRVIYEDFCVAPLQATVQLAARLGAEGASVETSALRRQQQRDATSAAFCQRFRDEYRSWLLARDKPQSGG